MTATTTAGRARKALFSTLTILLLSGAALGQGNGNGNGNGGGGGNDPPADPEIAYIEDGILWVMDADGANKTQVFAEGWVYWASWSPDGSHLAVNAHIGGLLGIWTVDAEGANLQLVKATHWTSYVYDLQWSPAPAADGLENILFIELTSEDANGTFDVFAIHPDGTGLVQLVDTPTPVDERSCTWSPDANRIAVASPGGTMVYELGFVGGQLAVIGTEEVPNMPENVREIEWARTQNKLAVSAFVEGSSNNVELWIVDLDSPANRQQVTYFEHQDRNPTWSPNDAFLAFERFPRPRKETGIRVLSSDGQTDDSLGAKQGSRPDWRR